MTKSIVLDYGSYGSAVGLADRDDEDFYETKMIKTNEILKDNFCNREIIGNGKVVDFDLFEKVLEESFKTILQVEPQSQSIVMTESPLNEEFTRKKTAEIIFETFGADEFLLIPTVLSTMGATGRTHGIFIDVGHDSGYIVPVYEGHYKKSDIKMTLGGKHITQKLQQQLLESYPESAACLVDFNLVNDIKEKLCDFTYIPDRPPYRGEDYFLYEDGEPEDLKEDKGKGKKRKSLRNLFSRKKEDKRQEKKEQKEEKEEKSIEDESKEQMNKFLYTLPDGKVIDVGPPICTTPDMLFQEDDKDPLSDCIHKKIALIARNKENNYRFRYLYGSTTVVGAGVSYFANFHNQLDEQIRIADPEDTEKLQILLENQNKQRPSWVGAAVISTLSTAVFVSKKEYEEKGFPDSLS